MKTFQRAYHASDFEKAVQRPATYTLSAFHEANKKERTGLLKAHGYVLNNRAYNLYISCRLTTSQILPSEIEGFTLCSLEGINELEAYIHTNQQSFKSVGFLPVEQCFSYEKQIEPR